MPVTRSDVRPFRDQRNHARDTHFDDLFQSQLESRNADQRESKDQLDRIALHLTEISAMQNGFALPDLVDGSAPHASVPIENLDELTGFDACNKQVPVFISPNSYAIVLNRRRRQVNGPN